MKTRLEEVNEMLADVTADMDLLIIRGGDRDKIWRLVERRTELMIEKHDLESESRRGEIPGKFPV